jgi:glycosyltransferase involved in cell wall biosynthesis
VHLVVAGDGPLREDVARQAEDLLPGCFTRLTVAGADMPDLYRSADVFLHLSKEESFGNVFVEAMACGLPIVGHDSTRLRWIVGDDEFLVDTGTPDAVAAALSRASEAGKVSSAARAERAQNFSWVEIARKYRDFISEIAKAG